MWSYFEGRRSGGNKDKEIESVKTIKKGVFHVKFSNSEGICMYIYSRSSIISTQWDQNENIQIIIITVTTSCTNLNQSDEYFVLHSTYQQLLFS